VGVDGLQRYFGVFMKDSFTDDELRKTPLSKTYSNTLLKRSFDYSQRHFSLNAQRAVLLLFIILQILFFSGFSIFQYMRIQDDASRVLRNTALLEAQQFETNMIALSYQMKVIGDAILLNHTVLPENSESFFTQELDQDWLDAVIVFNQDGDFVTSKSQFPLERILSPSILMRRSFRNTPLLDKLLGEQTKHHLFYWHSDGTDKHLMGLAAYRAVYDSHGRYLGGIVGYFKSTTMDYLTQKMEGQGLDLGPEGAIGLFDKNTGFIFVHTGDESHIISDGKKNPELMRYVSDMAIVHHYRSPLDGISRLGVFLNLNDRKWVLIVAFSESEILHDWYLQTVVSAMVVLIMGILQWQLLHYARINFMQRERLALEARSDPLTHLPNRRYFEEWIHKIYSRARRYQEFLSVLCIDLDYFKRINDVYGHDGGDAVLKYVARVIKSSLRESDIAARFGGEEFVVALPHTDLPGALQVAERIRVNLAEQPLEFKEQLISFTASFGVALVTQDELKEPEGIHTALTRADKALYRSKLGGRNRVTVADDIL
jgi:diguanylate cyclase (GGDEF)-like protein